MAFFFYVPNLILAEFFIRARRTRSSPAILQVSAAALLAVGTLTVLVGTYYFARYYWGPGILGALAG